MNPRLKEKYDNLVVKNLQTKFSLPNKLVVPKFLKIVLNMGLGASGNDKKILISTKHCPRTYQCKRKVR